MCEHLKYYAAPYIEKFGNDLAKAVEDDYHTDETVLLIMRGAREARVRHSIRLLRARIENSLYYIPYAHACELADLLESML